MGDGAGEAQAYLHDAAVDTREECGAEGVHDKRGASAGVRDGRGGAAGVRDERGGAAGVRDERGGAGDVRDGAASVRDGRSASAGQAAHTRSSQSFKPLASRLRPPHAHLELVQRPALVDKLRRTSAPLVLISAPAGFGKTTLLAQWVATGDLPSAWLQLGGGDDDPIAFLTYLTAALTVVAPVDPALIDLLQQREPPVEELVLPALGAALDSAPPFLLVLDDGHLVQNPTCWRYVAVLLEHLPREARVAVGTRSRPRLPLARLRAAGRLAELGASDLAMSAGEAARLLQLNDLDMDAPQLESLLETTEGWATGLYLAVLAARGRSEEDRFPAVHGDQREIAEYLGEEVVRRLPIDLQEFLLRTSILDYLAPGLCAAVSGRHDADLVLADLERDNLFISALDEAGEWYRYHHLFAELLGTQLRRREPDALPRLHGAAASWYHEHGDEESAVRHWREAGDMAAAAEPALMVCQKLVFRGQVESARRLIEGFSDEQLRSSFPLTFAAAWLYHTVIGDPRRGERWARAACTATFVDQPWATGVETWRSWQLGLRALLAPDGVTRMLEDAEASLALAEALGSTDISEAQRVLGVAAYLSGRTQRAERLFKDVLRDSGFPASEGYALGFLSLIATDGDRWDEATELDAAIAERSPALTLDITPGMYMALPMLLAHVRVLAHRGDPACQTHVDIAERHLEHMVPRAPWRLLLAAVVLGEAACWRDDLAGTQRWTAEAEALLARYPDAGILRRRTVRLRETLEERRMADPLTAAERRVLDLLPTQLTAEQMAARLFLTKSTVKTHVRHIYTKIGVNTRTAAVERARELGLLERSG